jgi:hypothetical protein
VTDENHVLVVGPNGRHMEVHKTTQARLPEFFPLVGEKPSVTTDGKNADKKKEPANGD